MTESMVSQPCPDCGQYNCVPCDACGVILHIGMHPFCKGGHGIPSYRAGYEAEFYQHLGPRGVMVTGPGQLDRAAKRYGREVLDLRYDADYNRRQQESFIREQDAKLERHVEDGFMRAWRDVAGGRGAH